MSTQPQHVSNVLPAKPLEVLVKGKVTHVRRHESKFYTLVVCPAADEYSSPQRVEIRSNARIGDQEQVISQRCRLGGFEGRPFKVTDRNTGEIRQARSVQHTLDAIEESALR